MSKVENRIVRLDLENGNFERNAAVSLKTLQNLKEGASMKGAKDGMEALSAAARNMDLGPIASGVQKISERFSSLGVIGMTALSNITNKLMDMGTQMLSGFTLEPIKEGFGEYELEMDSVKTIMNATGASIDTVNKYLGELNTYADDTIYSFSDMTSSIGKFTNNNVSLKDATAAIKGISNAAAYAGSTTQQASSAMYNFSQALSTGYLGLMDWKSIENAGMATTKFKEVLTETGLEMGTLVEKNGEYVTTTTNARGETGEFKKDMSGFRDAMQAQWITSDVLIASLKKYSDTTTKLGKDATKAATEFRTFSALMASTKEAIGTGWATTFKTLFGNIEEATKLWTAVGNVLGSVINAQSDFRNQALENWSLDGGRKAVLDGMTNIFKTVSSIGKQIKKAFEAIFPNAGPASLGKKLADISKAFRDLTKNLKPSKQALENIQRIFKGLFAAVHILIQPFKLLGKAIKAAFSGAGTILKPLGEKILSVLAVFGDWLVAIDAFLTRGASFKETIGAMIEPLKPFIQKIKDFISGIKGLFEYFKLLKKLGNPIDALSKMDIDGKLTKPVKTAIEVFNKFKSKVPEALRTVISTISEKLLPVFEKLRSALDTLKGKFGKVGNDTKKLTSPLDKLKDALSPVADFFQEKVVPAFQKFGAAIKKLKLEDWLKIIRTGIAGITSGGLLIFVKNIISAIKEGKKTFQTIQESLSKLTEGAVNVLDGVRGALEAYQKTLKAKALRDIAIAVGILAASVVVLGNVKPEKLKAGLAALGTTVGEMILLLKGFSWATKGFPKVQINKIALAMIELAIGLMILAKPIKELGQLSLGELAKGLIGIGGGMGVLVFGLREVSKCEGELIKGATAVYIMASALKKMAKVVRMIGTLDFQSWAQGLGGIITLFITLARFLNKVDFSDLNVKTGLGFMELAIALRILGEAVEQLGSLPIKQIIKGLGAVGVALFELTSFLNGTKRFISPKTGFAFIELAGAILIMGGAIKMIGQLSLPEIGKGLLGLGGGLGAVTAAINFLPPGTQTIAKAGGIAIAAAALIEMAVALGIVGSMDLATIGKGLLGLGGALVELCVGLSVMQANVAGAVALTVASVGLIAIAGAIAMFENISLADIGKALLAFAGVLTVLGLAAAILAPLSPVLLALAVAVGVMGAAVAVAALGVAAFALAMDTLAHLGDKAINQLIKNLHKLAKELPSVITEFVTGMIKGAHETITTFCETVSKDFPTIIKTGMNLLMQFLKGIRNNIGEITQVVIDIIVKFTKTISKNIKKIVEAGWEFIISLIEGISEGITKYEKRLKKAVDDLCHSILTAIFDWWGIPNPGEAATKVMSVGKDIMSGIREGLFQGLSNVIKAVQKICGSIKEHFKKMFGINSPSKVFAELGTFNMLGLAKGMTESSYKAELAGEKAAENIVDATRRAIDKHMQGDVSFNPVITPVIDFTNIDEAGSRLNKLLPNRLNTATINTRVQGTGYFTNSNLNQGSPNTQRTSGGTTFNYTQNNYSPKALSRIDIYRQTKNQISTLKGMMA